MVLQLPCHVVPQNDYLCGAEGGQIQLGPSGYSHRSVCILQGRWPWSEQPVVWQILGGGSSICLHTFWGAATITPGPMASSGSEASSSQCQGYAGWLPALPGALGPLPVNMASSVGVGKATGSFPQPPAWRHPTCHPSPSGVWGICRGPRLHCRVCQGEPLTTQHTIAGPSPVPPSGLFLPLRCPWGPGVWKVREGGNLDMSQAGQARWGVPPARFFPLCCG